MYRGGTGLHRVNIGMGLFIYTEGVVVGLIYGGDGDGKYRGNLFFIFRSGESMGKLRGKCGGFLFSEAISWGRF